MHGPPGARNRLLAIVIRGCCENSAWIARGTTTKRAGNRSTRVTVLLMAVRAFPVNQRVGRARLARMKDWLRSAEFKSGVD